MPIFLLSLVAFYPLVTVFLFTPDSDDGDTPLVSDGLWMRIMVEDAGSPGMPFTDASCLINPPKTSRLC